MELMVVLIFVRANSEKKFPLYVVSLKVNSPMALHLTILTMLIGCQSIHDLEYLPQSIVKEFQGRMVTGLLLRLQIASQQCL